MAKKKKKAAKKATKKAATSKARTLFSCSEDDLHASFIVMSGGEASHGLVEYANADLTGFISNFPVTMQEVRRGPTDNADRALSRLREDFEANDYDETPFLRVVGRVVEVLTIHRQHSRGKNTCSSGDVFHVFLEEIPQHSPYDPAEYRLVRPNRRGSQYDVSQDPGRTTIKNRLADLRNSRYLRTATTTRSGQGQGYLLTDDGLMLFDGWPEVEGLELNPPPRTRR